MSVQPGPHITAIAGDAVRAMYRSAVPLRALIAHGWATGNVHVGLPRELPVGPASPIVVAGGIALPPAARAALRERDCPLVRDYDEPCRVVGPGGRTGAALRGELEHELADAHAVVASTEPLALALRKCGADALVLPSILDPHDWTVLPQRAENRRPRVGWFRREAFDEQFVATVVRALMAEVDFVFFGRLPETLADVVPRLVCRSGVPLALFPASLAACDLDLVLAPLTVDAAGECSGNLLLLQAGILGYPVIATDIEAHRGLPVTLLPNAAPRWIAAVRERVCDRPALQRHGDVLRAAVLAHFTPQTWARRYLASWNGARQRVNA